jgi:hypothetical protein
MARDLAFVLVLALTASTTTVAAPTTATRTVASSKLYRIELTAPPCKETTRCEVELAIHALGGYKVNAEYPTKFVVAPKTTVTVDGTGTFTADKANKTVGTLTVRFRAKSAGSARLVGQLKLSVCTDEVCEIEAAPIDAAIPVT